MSDSKNAYDVIDDELKKLAGSSAPADDADDFLLDDDMPVDVDDAKEASDDDEDKEAADAYYDTEYGKTDGKKKEKKAGHQWAGLRGMTTQEILDNPDFNEAFANTIEKDAGFRAVLDQLADGVGLRNLATR